MTVAVSHSTTAAGPNDPTKQVSSDAWNAGHTITGLAAVAATGAYADLTGTPALATVATTGAYADLSGKPTLGTAAASAIGDFLAVGGTAANSSQLLGSTWAIPAAIGTTTASTGKFTSVFVSTNGTSGAPSFAIGTTGTGFFSNGGAPCLVANSGTRWQQSGAEFKFGGDGVLSWATNTGDATTATTLSLTRDAANNVLAQRNGANAQTSRIYGTFTDASNYVRASLAATSTTVTLAAESAGTGAADISLTLTPKGAGVVTAPLYASSYSPGSFTLATETCAVIANHLKLSGTQRATLAGTSRLVLL